MLPTDELSMQSILQAIHRMSADIANMRADIGKQIQSEIGALRQEMRGEISVLSAKVDDLSADMGDLRDGFDDLASTMDTSMGNLAHLTVRHITVKVYCDDATTPSGRGCLVACGDTCFVLTAAQVIAAVATATPCIRLELMFASKTVPMKDLMFYIPESYIVDGQCDIGLIRLPTGTFTTLKVADLGCAEIGTRLTGHGTVFLQGMVVHQDATTGRLLVHAISVPGSIGGPMVNDIG